MLTCSYSWGHCTLLRTVRSGPRACGLCSPWACPSDSWPAVVLRLLLSLWCLSRVQKQQGRLPAELQPRASRGGPAVRAGCTALRPGAQCRTKTRKPNFSPQETEVLAQQVTPLPTALGAPRGRLPRSPACGAGCCRP